MGKYMRKAKTTGEVAVMDLSLGVCTRAKTLALQRQASTLSSSAAGYLQLRSRRLEKKQPQPPIILPDTSKRPKQGHGGRHQNPSSTGDAASSKAGSRVRPGPADLGSGREEKAEAVLEGKNDKNDEKKSKSSGESKDLGVEASFGDNVLEVDGRERNTRESTPCSLMRDPETIRTPGSTTRPTGSAEINRRIHNSMHRSIPTAHEMDEFFSGAEEEQQRKFVERYNYDPVNDRPLPGRYEWEKLDG